VFLLWLPGAFGQTPETVAFDSADGKLKLTGYLYLPDAKVWPGPRPAIVLLHGRTGVYSSRAKRFDATTLSARTTLWGRFWADRGYAGLYVDTFGPRGHHRGFDAGTNDGRRPSEINEITVRPLDAYQGLKYLRGRRDVQPDRVFLQGWSNGGSATLATLAERTFGGNEPRPEAGFRAAIAVYPACARITKFYGQSFRTYAPVLLLIGTEDEEVSYRQCEKLAQTSRRGDIEFVRYSGATHSYDTPAARRQAVAANLAATEDTKARSEAFLKRFLTPERK
jgi:carboxymethylenebutenolidase